jgi:hypothetical protein
LTSSACGYFGEIGGWSLYQYAEVEVRVSYDLLSNIVWIPLEKKMRNTCLILIMLIMLALSAFVLSACAGVDASVLDTAECMGKGQWGVGMAYTMGIEVPDWLEIDAQDIYASDSATLMQYAEIEYGLEEDVDAKLRFGLGVNGNSGKLLLKKQISKMGNTSTAFVFGGGVVSANEDFWEPVEHYGQDIDYTLYSSEAQLLYTKEYKPGFFATIAARGNYHFLYEKTDDLATVKREFYHGGIRANLKRYYKGFCAIIELGAEAPLSVEGWQNVYPWAGLKVSWDLKKKK